MAQPCQAPSCRPGAAGRADALARRPQARRRYPHGRDFRHYRHRRRFGDGEQFPPVAAPARLVHADPHAFHLCLVGRHLRRRQPRLRRRLVAGRAAPIAADESLRLEQAAVRCRGRRALRQKGAAAAALGRPEIFQRLRPQRISQGSHDERAGQGVRRCQGRPAGAAVQVAPGRHCRRRPVPRFHLRR